MNWLLAAWGQFAVARQISIISATVCLLPLLLLTDGSKTFDKSSEGYCDTGDPALTDCDRLLDLFGDNDYLIVCIEAADYLIDDIQTQAMASNWVADRFLLFGELGLRTDHTVTPIDAVLPSQQGGWDQKEQILAVAGLEYNRFGNSLRSLELNDIHFHDHDRFMREDRNPLSVGARAYWTALNDRLTVMWV